MDRLIGRSACEVASAFSELAKRIEVPRGDR
jgi:hypothetical protein